VVKIALESQESTKWLAILLSGDDNDLLLPKDKVEQTE
jgi:hypothetical protein